MMKLLMIPVAGVIAIGVAASTGVLPVDDILGLSGENEPVEITTDNDEDNNNNNDTIESLDTANLDKMSLSASYISDIFGLAPYRIDCTFHAASYVFGFDNSEFIFYSESADYGETNIVSTGTGIEYFKTLWGYDSFSTVDEFILHIDTDYTSRGYTCTIYGK